MKVTTKGQVTIPQHIREKLGITPNTEVDFVEEKDRIYLIKKMKTARNVEKKQITFYYLSTNKCLYSFGLVIRKLEFEKGIGCQRYSL